MEGKIPVSIAATSSIMDFVFCSGIPAVSCEHVSHEERKENREEGQKKERDTSSYKSTTTGRFSVREAGGRREKEREDGRR